MSRVATTETRILNSQESRTLLEVSFKPPLVRLGNLSGSLVTWESIDWEGVKTPRASRVVVRTVRGPGELSPIAEQMYQELSCIEQMYQMKDRDAIVRYLAERPHLVQHLLRLPARIEKLWGQGKTLRLGFVSDPEDGSKRLLVEFEGSGYPERDASLLVQLDAARAQNGEAIPDGIVVLTF